jgi:hypothetical protein
LVAAESAATVRGMLSAKTVVLLLTWLVAEPAVVRHYDSVAECEKVLAETTRDPGTVGFCMPLPLGPVKPAPDFRDGMRPLAVRQ